LEEAIGLTNSRPRWWVAGEVTVKNRSTLSHKTNNKPDASSKPPKHLFGSGQLDELGIHITALRHQLRRKFHPKAETNAITTAERDDRTLERRQRVVDKETARHNVHHKGDDHHRDTVEKQRDYIEGIAAQQLATDVPLAVFVNTINMTSSQKKQLEDRWKCQVFDRFGVILSIFETRAHTREAKLSVELALVK
jgi:hypothetical protein